MASACLPNVFRTVEIMDPATGKLEGYWDGGYSGNPALFPLYDKTLPDDIVIVNINPIVRETLPRSASEILNRINEISFNSSLLSELRSINFVRRLIADNKLPPGTMKEVKVHMISDDKLMNSLTAETKLMPTTGLLGELKTAGRAAASRFLREHAHKIGKSNSIDLAGVYS
jgi:NTE family protein